MMDTSVLTGLPIENGEPVFESPWQARTFALTVQLHENGAFLWTEWADELSSQIADYEQNSQITDSNCYYTLWQTALENLIVRKEIVRTVELKKET